METVIPLWLIALVVIMIVVGTIFLGVVAFVLIRYRKGKD